MADHRSAAGRRYRGLVRDITEQLGVLPPSAAPLLKTYGRLGGVEIPELERQWDAATARGRTAEARRVRRALTVARVQFARTTEQLERLAAAQPADLASLFARRLDPRAD